MREIDNYRDKKFSGRDARLFREWEQIDKQFGDSREIEYIIRKRNGSDLPVVYDIWFNIKSMVGIQEPDEKGMQKPIFGKEHVMRITLPNNYPSAAGQPEFNFTTDVWHPNIRYFGDFKGRVCLNPGDSGTQTPLAEYINRVMDYLTYDDYHAKNEYPYPEDLTVAEWVLKQAEPNGWVKFKQD